MSTTFAVVITGIDIIVITMILLVILAITILMIVIIGIVDLGNSITIMSMFYLLFNSGTITAVMFISSDCCLMTDSIITTITACIITELFHKYCCC